MNRPIPYDVQVRYLSKRQLLNWLWTCPTPTDLRHECAKAELDWRCHDRVQPSSRREERRRAEEAWYGKRESEAIW